MVIPGRFGLGLEHQVTVELNDLVSLGRETLVALLMGSGDAPLVALSQLPLQLSGQARFERGLMLGLAGEVGKKLLGAGLYAEIVWSEAGPEVSVAGIPCENVLRGLLSNPADSTITDETFTLLDELGAQVVEWNNR